MPASLREGAGGVSRRAVRAPQNHTPVCAVRLWGCTLPLEGAGLVVWFAGRPPVPSRPVELHPLGQLLLTAVFQDFSGLEIDLHWSRLSCARSAPLRFSTTSTVFIPRGFSEGCVLQRCTCGCLCSPLTARSCR